MLSPCDKPDHGLRMCSPAMAINWNLTFNRCTPLGHCRSCKQVLSFSESESVAWLMLDFLPSKNSFFRTIQAMSAWLSFQISQTGTYRSLPPGTWLWRKWDLSLSNFQFLVNPWNWRQLQLELWPKSCSCYTFLRSVPRFSRPDGRMQSKKSRWLFQKTIKKKRILKC